VKYVLFYDLAEGAMDLAMQHYPAHRARLDQFHERGDLLSVGTWTDAPMGAMAVFASREAVDEFTSADPFLEHGVVGTHRVREWDEIYLP